MEKFEAMLENLNDKQREAVLEIGRHVSINAGAGSGKTKVLAVRYLNILLSNKDNNSRTILPENILAITYTNKAANEMKARIRKYMEELAQADDPFWSNMVLQLNNSQISTIHSLCSRILQENCIEAGLDPDFTYAEEYEGDLFEKNFLDNFLHREIYLGNKELLELLKAYGYEDFIRESRKLAGNISDIMAEDDLTAAYKLGKEAEAADKKEFLESLVEISKAYHENKKSVTLKRLYDNLPQIAEELEKELPDYEFIYSSMRKLSGKMNSIGELVKTAKQKFVQLRKYEVEHRGEIVVSAWQNVLQKYYEELTEYKRNVNFLSFDDLENMTLELLEKYPEVRKRYFVKFPYIMVDEFQDANEKQKKIIYYLCGDEADRLTLYEDRIKNLFIVGDPKQSIYRFRGAQVHVFNKVRKDIEAAGGNNIYMNTNYRSDKKIIEGVNHFFGDKRIMGTVSESDDINHIAYDAMFPKPAAEDGEPIKFLQFSFLKNKFDLQPKAEANAIVKEISSLMVQDFFEEKNGTPKKLTYGDIAILVKSTKLCGQLIKELKKADIEYVLVDGKNLYEQQEILDLIHLLKVVCNKYASVELVGILRSPLFGLKDGTIAMLCMNNNGFVLWDMLCDVDEKIFGEEEGYKVERARRILLDLRKDASLMTLETLVQHAWKLLNIDFIYGNQEYGAMKLANAKKFLEDVAYFCNTEKGGLQEYLNYVDLRRATGEDAAQANMPSMNAVKIMTIHKSKGLDFPVVFVPMLDFAPKKYAPKTIYIPGKGLGVCVAMPDGSIKETGCYKMLMAEDSRLDEEEQLRNLYVAMTRASKRLFLSGGALQKNLDSADMVNLLPQNSYMQLRQLLLSNPSRAYNIDVRIGIGSEFVVDRSLKQLEVPLASVGPLAAFASNGLSMFSPSMLKKYLHCPRLFYYHYIANVPEIYDTEDAGEVLSGSLTGSILHKALELYNEPFYDEGTADTVMRRALNLFEISDSVDASDLHNVFKSYLTSSIYLSNSGSVEKVVKELNFSVSGTDVQSNEIFFTGQIDKLAFNTDGTMEIVDYKTASLGDNSIPELAYRVQLAVYIAAAEQLYPGRKVTAAKLHFLKNQKEYVLDMDELPDLKEKINEAICQIKKHNGEDGYPCKVLSACEHCPYSYICSKG